MTTVMSSSLAGAEMMTFFAPAAMWPLAFAASVKRPVDLDDVLDAQLLPRQRGRAFLDRQALDLVAVDDEHVVLCGRGRISSLPTLPVELALRGVVLEQVGEVVGRDDIVDRDDVDLLAEQPLFDQGAKHQAADPPETVDADLHGSHCRCLSIADADPARSRSTCRDCRSAFTGYGMSPARGFQPRRP